jgi:hypothetical protein
MEGNGLSTRIHVTGEPSTGFCLEIDQDYDLAADGRKYEKIPLGSLTTAQIEDLAPGPSLRSHRDKQVRAI